MTEKEEKESEKGKSGSHKDNDLSRVQKVMKDNDLPFFYSSNDNDGEDRDEAGDTD